MSHRRAVLLLAASALFAGCTPHPVGPARTFSKYEGKAVTTAESARSALETVRLAARTGTDVRAFGPYLSVLISEQEDTLSSLQGTFASIQPPDAHADTIRRQLDTLLDESLDQVVEIRIAVRRGQLAGLAMIARDLRGDIDALSSFIADHDGGG